MKQKEHSIRYNFIMNAALNLSAVLTPFLTYPYATRVLGAESYGKAIFASYVANWLMMFAQLGIPTFGLRACAACRDDEAKLKRTVRGLITLNLVTAVVTYSIFLVLLVLVPRFRQDPLLFLVVSLPVLLNAVGGDWFFKGLEEYGYVAARDIGCRLLSVALLFLLVHGSGDYLLYGVTIAVGNGAPAVLNCIQMLRRLGGSRGFLTKETKVTVREAVSEYLKPVLTFFTLNVAISIYTNMDVVMLGFLSTDAQVGFYAAATRLKTVSIYIVTALGGVLLPRASHYLGEGKQESFRKLIALNFSFVFLTAAPMVLYLLFMADQVIYFLSGQGFAEAILPMRLISVTILLIGLTNVMGMQILVAGGREKETTRSTIYGACVNLIVNALLIPKLGAVGAVIGTVFAEITVFLAQVLYLRGELGQYLQGLELWKIVLANLLAVCAMAALRVGAGYGAPASALVCFYRILATGVLFCGCYAVALVVMKERHVMEVLKRK